MKKKLILAFAISLLALLLVGCSSSHRKSLKYVSNGDGTCYVSGYNWRLSENLIVPETSPRGDTVVAIGDAAFRNCEKLKTVSLPESVTKIGTSAFETCINLEEVVLSEGLVHIGDSAFENCASLRSIHLPDGVKIIGNHAFFYCKSLADLSLPDSLQVIGDLAFSRCTSLTYLEIPEGVSVLRDSLFLWCESLVEIVIPRTVSVIGENVFLWCDSLERIYYGGSPSDWSRIEIDSENDDLLFAERYHYSEGDPYKRGNFWHYVDGKITVWPEYQYSYGLIYLPLGNGTCEVGGIGTCTDEDLVIPPVSPEGDRVIGIADSAFEICDRIVTVTLPDGIKSIGERAFFKCTSLTEVHMPPSVKTVYMDAFTSCSALEGVYITDIVAWCDIVFSDFDSNPLHVAKNLYLDGELLTELLIPKGVKEIRPYTFWHCESLTVLKIGNDVQRIGSYAFRNCTNVRSLAIGNGVQTIGSHAFQYCDSLRVLAIGEGVIDVGYAAFSGCFRLSDMILGSGVTLIDVYAFSDCAALTNVYYTAGKLPFSQITIASDNDPIKNANIYFYTKNPPTEEGNFWHMSDGVVTAWPPYVPSEP